MPKWSAASFYHPWITHTKNRMKFSTFDLVINCVQKNQIDDVKCQLLRYHVYQSRFRLGLSHLSTRYLRKLSLCGHCKSNSEKKSKPTTQRCTVGLHSRSDKVFSGTEGRSSPPKCPRERSGLPRSDAFRFETETVPRGQRTSLFVHTSSSLFRFLFLLRFFFLLVSL